MRNINLRKKIPDVQVPSIENYKIEPLNERIVSLRGAGFLVESQYYQHQIKGSYYDCYVRESLVDMLHKAECLLPKGLRLKIYDGYRPICIQQYLWDFYRKDVLHKNPGCTDDEIDFKTSFFVSKPSYDVLRPSLHNTGGAIDVTLSTDSGYELNMGTIFDDFTDRAWTNHFEHYTDVAEVRKNRRILYNVMTAVGFTNLPSEWWHYDYGDKFWSYFTGKPAKYKGIIDIDFPHRLCM